VSSEAEVPPVRSGPVVVDVPERSRFEITVDGQLAGFAAYRRRDGAVEFSHTEIGPEFEGQGLGSRLVASALDAVRAQGLAVRPYCPFVRRWLTRHPAYVDLVPAAERAQFGLSGVGDGGDAATNGQD
jgi:predicted GNAT family acetyltransferase